MNIPSRRLLILASTIFCTIGCTNKDEPGPVMPQTFKWSIDNGTIQTAETISFVRVAGYNYIYAGKGATDIFLATSATSTGSYSTLSANADMGLTLSGNQYANLGCEITISSNSGSKLKGTFSGTFGLVNVDTVSVTGSFEDVLYN